MTRVLAFPSIGHLQVHNTIPRLDLKDLRYHSSHKKVPNVKYHTTYQYISPKVYRKDNGRVEENIALTGAIEFFRQRMWFPPNTCVSVETQRTLITPKNEFEGEQWECIKEATQVGILIVSHRNIDGGYYMFKKHCDDDDCHIRTAVAPGNMVLFEQSSDVVIDYAVAPMTTKNNNTVGIRDTLIISV